MGIEEIVQWAKDICSIATCAALLIKPVREWLLGTKEIREGQRCLLRAEIVRIYYRHLADRQLREYEFKNMQQCYEAYKAMNGNSFIDRIHAEMLEWDII
jgi:hypothetical protein